jgi:hypothetical protein
MAKGNHVFNDFSGIVLDAYKSILSNFAVNPGDPKSLTYDKHLNALENKEGRAGDVALAECELKNGRLKDSYAMYRQIADHKKMERIHEMQDDGPVLLNDPNSQAFSNASDDFRRAALDWASGVPEADPSTGWREMVKHGFDQGAHDKYLALASTPKARAGRENECHEIRKFISAELTKLVFNWLLLLRADLKGAKMATYDGNRQAWKDALRLPDEYVPPASGSKNG